MGNKPWGSSLKDCLTFITIALVIVGAAWAGIMHATADGKTEFCYIERGESWYSLKASVPWDIDRVIERAVSVDAAATAAERVGCQLR